MCADGLVITAVGVLRNRMDSSGRSVGDSAADVAHRPALALCSRSRTKDLRKGLRILLQTQPTQDATHST